MALTKAEMAERLFDEVGLNKREAKEFVDAYFDVLLQLGEVHPGYPFRATAKLFVRWGRRAPGGPSRRRRRRGRGALSRVRQA